MYDIECPELTKYVMNRKQVLNDVMNYYNVKRDQAKQLFIILLYGGSFRSWNNEHKIKNNTTINRTNEKGVQYHER